MQALVVADQATRRQLEEFFRFRHYGVTACDDPEEARAAIDREFHQIAVFDLTSGEADALDLCRRLRARPDGARATVLVLPAAETPEAMRKALEAGADDYLMKPVNEAVLKLRLAIGQRGLAGRLIAEARLERSERRFRTLVETLNEGLFQVDEQGIIEYANSRLAQITGYTQDELVGRSADELLVEAKYRERLPGQTLLGTGTGSEQYSLPLLTKAGEPVWVNLTAAPLPPLDGDSRSSVGLVQDITEQRAAEEGLRYREEYFRVLLENASDLITIIDLDGRILYQSLSSDRLLGWPADELVGRDFFEFLPEDDRARFAETIDTSLEEAGATAKVQLRFNHKDGHWRYLESLCNNLVDNPVVGGVVLTSRDMTDRRRVEAALKKERAFFEQLFRNSPSGIVILDNSDRIVDANRAFVDLFQYEVRELEGRPLNEFIVPEELREEASELSQVVFQRQSVMRETVRRRKDGTLVDVAILGYPIELAEQRIGAFGLYTDITERKNAERKLFHNAFHDALTGLPNRKLLNERLERDLRRARRRVDYQFALFFVDLDGFKEVNDNLGHAAGDFLLKETARRLEECLRPGDTVGRLGGDEFTVLLEDIQGPYDTARIAERILESLDRPVAIEDQEERISASIGIAMSSTGYERVEDLMRDADIAMYRAKARGKGCYEIFDNDMQQDEIARLQLEGEVERALDEEQMVLHYQPMVSLTTGRAVGFEALVRWRHPEKGLVMPAELLPVCEASGLIVPLGLWVLRQACRQATEWQRRFPEHDAAQVSVNLSVRELFHPDFLEHLDQALADTGAPPSVIGIELTEELMGEDPRQVEELLWEIHKRGPRLAVDDFGTGRTSLAMLHRLPVDAVKIDRGLVAAMAPGAEPTEVVRAAAALGESLGMAVVAEGVETPEQRKLLRELGIGFAQGHLFSEPLPSEGAAELLAEGRRW